MPTAFSVRRVTPRQTAKRRESIAAFEHWQRNWSASVPSPSVSSEPKRSIPKECGHHSSAHTR